MDPVPPEVKLTPDQLDMKNAIKSGNFKRVCELLDKGLRVDECDNEGWTALGRAASFGQAELTRMFLAEGVDPNLSDPTGITALHVAAFKGHTWVIRELLRAGADPLARDKQGKTPMDWAQTEEARALCLGQTPPREFPDPQPLFHVGEQVLCRQPDMTLFIAKILRISRNPSNTALPGQLYYYFIHYQGWKSTHDCEAPEGLLLKLSRQSIKEQLERQVTKPKKKARPHAEEPGAKHARTASPAVGAGGASSPSLDGPAAAASSKSVVKSVVKSAAKASSAANAHSGGAAAAVSRPAAAAAATTTTTTTTANVASAKSSREQPRTTKTARAPATPISPTTVHVPDAQSSRAEKSLATSVEGVSMPSETTYAVPCGRLAVELPPVLAEKLADDQDQINRLHRLIALPCSPSVREIVEQFMEHARSAEGVEQPSTKDADSLLELFDGALGAHLLYRFERPNYEQLHTKDLVPSDVYGAEHLLRLAVKMPEYCAGSKDHTASHRILTATTALLSFMAAEADHLFKAKYVDAKPDYLATLNA